MGKSIAVVNFKGGIGKTTTSIAIAAYAASIGLKVLLVDTDTQGSASLALGQQRSSNLAEYIEHKQAILSPISPQLSLITGGPLLAKFYNHTPSFNFPSFDLVVFDTAPSISPVQIGVLESCDYYVVPTQLSYLALEGIASLLEILSAAESTRPMASLLSIVVSQPHMNKLGRDIYKALEIKFKNFLNPHLIPFSRRLDAAAHAGLDIYTYAPNSSVALAYKAASRHVLQKIGFSA